MENKIPTPEEWLASNKEFSKYDVAEHDEGGYLGINEKALYKMMNEYAILKAKHYVEEALNTAAETKISGQYTVSLYPRDGDDKNRILTAYPLTNIK